VSEYKELELPEGYGYNCIFKHQINTRQYGLSASLIPKIHKLSEGKWGWHFRPHSDMDYNSDQWYEKQTCFLSFEKQTDLINVKLLIEYNK
tara:strand:- start:287 stop:559 length:273 start_codon:yes stop_codon:yes gene_type:complete